LNGTKLLVLPLAYSIGITTSLVFFIMSLRKRFPEFLSLIKPAFLHTFTSSVVMGTVAYHSLQFFDTVFDINTLLGIFMQGVCSAVLGILAGVFLLKLMGNKEIEEIWSSLHKRFWKAKPLAAEQETL
jgi:peptidoglycan biosynthesis protein MviN/MurJ (putative lipid II flippase)